MPNLLHVLLPSRRPISDMMSTARLTARKIRAHIRASGCAIAKGELEILSEHFFHTLTPFLSVETIPSYLKRILLRSRTPKSQGPKARLDIQIAQAQRIERLAHIFFEHYHCPGPVHVLFLVKALYQAYMDLAILVPDQSLTSKARTYLGDVCLAQHQLTHEMVVLQRSIDLYRRALAHNSTFPHGRTTRLNLAYALWHRYQALDSSNDYIEALQLLDEVKSELAISNDDALNRTWTLTLRGILRSVGSTWGIITFSPEGIAELLADLRTAAIPSLPLSRYLLFLAAETSLLRILAHTTRQEELLRTGMEVCKRALRLCTEDSEVLRDHLENERFGLLQISIKSGWDSTRAHFTAAVELAKLRHELAEHSARSSYTSALWLFHWAWATLEAALGLDEVSLDLIEQAVEKMRRIRIIFPPSHSLRSLVESEFVYVLSVYFHESGRVSVLDEIIDLHALVRAHIMKRPYFAGNVASTMLIRAEISDSEDAGRLVATAVRLCQDRQALPGFATFEVAERSMINRILMVATRLQIKMGISEPALDVHTKLQLARDACAQHPKLRNRSVYVEALADALMSIARSQCDASMLTEAIDVLDEELSLSVSMTNYGASFERMSFLVTKADIYVTKGALMQSSDHFATAWKLYEQAVTCATTPERSRKRLQAAIQWASQASEHGYMIDAFNAYSHAIRLLPRVVDLGEEVIGRVEALRQASGLAAASVAIALTLGDVSSAIGFLEQARGILWLQSFQTKYTGVASLPANLQSQYIQIGERLSRAENLTWTTRRHAAKDLDGVISKIRTIPTFERFLLPPLIEEIESALKAQGGFAIVVIPSKLFTDVIILGGDRGHSHLRLEKLNISTFKHMAQTFIPNNGTDRGIKVMTRDSSSASAGMQVLSDLWADLVKPIFHHIGLWHMSDMPRKRVWWCPAGASASLPLHAAGTYDSSPTNPRSDHVGALAVSSYVPTLTALYRILTQQLTTEQGPVNAVDVVPKMLLVAQTDSAGLPSLPNTQLEVARVQATLPHECLLKAPEPHGISVAEALKRVADANILHIACHSVQNQDSPLNSGFSLQDGRLTLGQLMRIDIPHAQLAYLSACESAGMDESRPDESLNLAGAMLFVGFKSVIASMWAMDDVDGPFMAERIYKHIFREGKLNMSAIPNAVEDAARELRESGVCPSRWATYVHFGV